ncbi:MAG: hypothetical protein ACP5HQ_01375 [Thermoprotei archaeon]
MRGLSDVVSTIMILVIVLIFLFPLILYIENSRQYESYLGSYTNDYIFLKQLEDEQVNAGYPSLFYNGTSIISQYANGTFVPKHNLTIVGILYLNQQGVWQNITSLKYPITIYTDKQVIQLPSESVGRPIAIATSYGNLFILSPGSALGPYSP